MIRVYATIGEDLMLQVTVVDENGTAVDLSAYQGYGVHFYYLDASDTIAKYSKNSVTGYLQQIDTTNEATGVIVVNMRRDVTINGVNEKDVYYEVVTQQSDSDFDENRFMSLTDRKYFFTFRTTPAGTIPAMT